MENVIVLSIVILAVIMLFRRFYKSSKNHDNGCDKCA